MTIANTVLKKISVGNRKIVIGKSVVSGGTATGNVNVGLEVIESFQIVTGGDTAYGISANETFPLRGTDVTIVNEANDLTSYWVAVGY